MNNQEEQKNDKTEKDRPFHIVVNGQAKEWSNVKISFDDVIKLAFGSIPPNPNIVYTVTFKNASSEPPKGTMVKGDGVKVKNGTIFNATATDKS